MEWATISSQVAAVCERTADLLCSLQGLDRPAVGSWTVSDTAAHLTHIYEFDALIAAGGNTGIDDLRAMPTVTANMVAGETDRDPRSLATRIRAAHSRLAEAAATGADGAREWLGGVRLTPASLGAHVVSESLLHGLDLARAMGKPWPLPAAECRLALEGFLFCVLADPRSHGLVLDTDRLGRVSCRYELRVRGGGHLFLSFDRGELNASTDAPPGRVDCRISADAAALLLVTWGRSGQWSQIARGKLLATGPKPWLGLKLTSYFRDI